MAKNSGDPHGDALILGIVGLYAVAFLLNSGLLLLVLLREDPQFWINEGGYPVWLREFVLVSFYPLLFIQFVVLVGATILQIRVLPLEGSFRLGVLLVVLLLWVFFGIIMGIMLANNVDNLLNGRDLHYHPPNH